MSQSSYDTEFLNWFNLSLERFGAEHEAPGMRISTKSKTMLLSWRRVERSISRIGVASAVLQTLIGLAKISIYQPIYIPALIYGHQMWEMTKGTRSRIQDLF